MDVGPITTVGNQGYGGWDRKVKMGGQIGNWTIKSEVPKIEGVKLNHHTPDKYAQFHKFQFKTQTRKMSLYEGNFRTVNIISGSECYRCGKRGHFTNTAQ